jgi:hypothetical protein
VVGDCHTGRFSPRQLLITAQGAYRRLRIPANALRESILVDAELLDWPSGSQVRIGKSVLLRVMFGCEPCAKLNDKREGLFRDVGSDRGLLARVIRGGMVRAGDHIAVRPHTYQSFPNDWQRRLHVVLAKMPKRSWIPYVRLAELNGVHRSYCRVFPRVLGFSRFGGDSTVGVRRDEKGGLVPVMRADRPIDDIWSGWHVFDGENVS